MRYYRYLCVREVFVNTPILDPTFFSKDTYPEFIRYVQKKVDLKGKLERGVTPCLRWPLMDIATSFVLDFPPTIGWEYDLGDTDHLCDLTVFIPNKIRYIKYPAEFYNDTVEDTYVLWVEGYTTPMGETPSATFDEFYTIFTELEGLNAQTEIVAISPSASAFVMNEIKNKPEQSRFFSSSLIENVQLPNPDYSTDPHTFIRPRKEIFKDLTRNLFDRQIADPSPMQRTLSEQLN